ncbi:hypothetical protein NMG60_11016541 [Bertholletia excelsa]
MAAVQLAARLFLLLSLLLLGGSELGASRSQVKFLPGFDGPLPFELETGYVGVDESEDVQFFYYFVKSQSDPELDPLLVWFSGGPGCSSFVGFIYEIGPLYFDAVQTDASLPKLVMNPNSWSQGANIIFVDFPVGTGFSYGRTSIASHSSDLQACSQAHQFLRKWLIDYPEFQSNPFYVGGDSYAGIPVPIIVQLLANGNEQQIQPYINLQGYLLGNPLTNSGFEENYKIPFAHGMGLISDELFESLQQKCNGKYSNIDSHNPECSQAIQAYEQCITGFDIAYILEPNCGIDSPRPFELFNGIRRPIYKKNMKLIDPEPAPLCPTSRTKGHMLASVWLNRNDVREALHIQKGSTKEWIMCNIFVPYTQTTLNSFPYHVNLSTKGYRSLIYSGDHDMIFTFRGTQAWIKSLNYSIDDDWHPWFVEGQTAGYTRTYSNRMTFATVKGGGHIAPEYRPLECYAMFKRWISHQPL